VTAPVDLVEVDQVPIARRAQGPIAAALKSWRRLGDDEFINMTSLLGSMRSFLTGCVKDERSHP